MDYEQAKYIMGQHRAAVEGSRGVVKAKASPIKKNLENSTTLSYIDPHLTSDAAPNYELRLFGNPILVFHPSTFEIHDHGWYSRTTHIRLNQYLPAGHSIYSKHISQLQKPQHISFVKTPHGTYPYNLPLVLNYEGFSSIWYTHQAQAAVEEMPGYIDDYIARLLKRLLFSNDIITDSMFSLRNSDTMFHSRVLAKCIVDKFHFGELAFAAITHSGVEQESYGGLDFGEIIEILLAEGHDAFKPARTANQISRRMENAFKHGKPMVTIRAEWIKSRLRPLLYEYIIDSLGFARKEWNRR